MSEEKFSTVKLGELLEAASPAPWFASPEFEDDNGLMCASVGPYDALEHRPNDPHHYEDTIGEFWGGNHSGPENARLVAYLVTHAEYIMKIIARQEKRPVPDANESAERLLTGKGKVGYRRYEEDARTVARAYLRLRNSKR